jgi:Xaa-Pro dipeptidase
MLPLRCSAAVDKQPRQRRNFFYLSGCTLPDSYLTYTIETDELTLFIPPVDPESVIWTGLPLSPDEALEKYDVDVILSATEVNASLAHYGTTSQAATKRVFAIDGQVSAETSFLAFQETNFEFLRKAIEECRREKDEYETALLRHANAVTTEGHIAVMKAVKSARNERELEAAFTAACMARGCRENSYHPIVASGTSAATLHYQRNDADLIDTKTGERKLNLLIDAGVESRTYCADITRVFPLSGKFTPESRAIYDIVLEMQLSCLGMIKAGVRWEDVHAHSHRVAIAGLLRLGILRGSADEIFDHGVSVAFFPHGLGHYLGMDTHDVGGNPSYEDKNPMYRYLRIRGRLVAGGVVTVEPGVSRVSSCAFDCASNSLTLGRRSRYTFAGSLSSRILGLLSWANTSTPLYLKSTGMSAACASKTTFS